jgi:hypothetical protein
MHEVLSPDEVSALESFRVGDSGPLKELPLENFQRVVSRLNWSELLLLDPARQRDCRHLSTVVDGLVRKRVKVTRCLDCGRISLDEEPVATSA